MREWGNSNATWAFSDKLLMLSGSVWDDYAEIEIEQDDLDYTTWRYFSKEDQKKPFLCGVCESLSVTFEENSSSLF